MGNARELDLLSSPDTQTLVLVNAISSKCSCALQQCFANCGAQLLVDYRISSVGCDQHLHFFKMEERNRIKENIRVHCTLLKVSIILRSFYFSTNTCMCMHKHQLIYSTNYTSYCGL